MAAEREDTDPTPHKGGTEPGLGPPSSPTANGAARPEPPSPVDFDALHAALGAVEEPSLLKPRPSDADRPSAPSASPPAATATATRPGESQGRSSAQYASARPHTIPPTRAPDEPPDIPAVIVASDDTVPTAPPAMTTPLGARPPGVPIPAPPSGPRGAHPGALPHAAVAVPHPSAPSYPFTPPQSFAPHRLPPQPTMRMPERPRRQKNPTVIVRRRGPSNLQKVAAFMAMLFLVTAVGIAVIVWRRPAWLGIEPLPFLTPPAAAPSPPSGAATASAPTSAAVTATAASTTMTGTMTLPASGSATAPTATAPTATATATATSAGAPPSASTKPPPLRAVPKPRPLPVPPPEH